MSQNRCHDPVERYLDALHPPIDPLLEAIEAEGRAQQLPLVHAASARLLRSLVIATSARRVLEIGTCIGYSAIWMARALPPDGMLITLEVDPARAAVARTNIERAGLSDRISVVVGDATRYLHKVAGPFDLVFQDSNKQLYEAMLDRIAALLGPEACWPPTTCCGTARSSRVTCRPRSAIRLMPRPCGVTTHAWLRTVGCSRRFSRSATAWRCRSRSDRSQAGAAAGGGRTEGRRLEAGGYVGPASTGPSAAMRRDEDPRTNRHER